MALNAKNIAKVAVIALLAVAVDKKLMLTSKIGL